jgi:tellurite resistance protein
MDDKNKTALISIKVTPEELEEFRISVMLRGTTMSALISQFMSEVVKVEKGAVPEAFQRKRAVVDDFSDLINHSTENVTEVTLDAEEKRRQALELVENVGSKLSEAEKQKAILLYDVFLKHGDIGLDIAQDLMDERSTSHPLFSEDAFRNQLHERLKRFGDSN